jgi:GH25 family lysozyme M1 (1,4-beta-N-acetylmuramidase)
MICDVSAYQGAIDWGQLRSKLDFAILRSSVGLKQDTRYREYVSGCTRYGIPYHAYHYIKATTEAEARDEAKVCATAIWGTSPLFVVIDAEYGGIKAENARAICEAFEDGLRHYIANDIRVALYIGHHLYRPWALDYSRYDYVWIPRYGKNSGQPETRPDYPCDLWQYTSRGRLTGINGDVDLDMLTGTKPMEFFTGKTNDAGGETVANPYDKYIYSTGTHWISNSGSDERGQYNSGKAGDQTGKEWQLKAWYSRPWSVVLRYPDIRVGLKIADLACAAALNDNIGYDQYQRTTYWTQLQAAGYDPSKIAVPCEEDCTAGVTANVKAVGVLMGIPALSAIPIDTYSANMRSRFVSAGFEALTASKYLKSPDYLLPGDILLYDGHHAATNITYGAKVRPSKPVDTTTPPADVEVPGISLLGTRILRRGNAGADVEQLQKALMSLGYDVGSWGADGDFGSATDRAVRAFQRDHGLDADGEFGPKSLAALKAALAGDELEQPEPPAAQTVRHVEITGGTVNVRSAPGTNSRILGVEYEGVKLPYQGESRDVNGTPWYLVEYNNENAWVSGKYSKLMEG